MKIILQSNSDDNHHLNGKVFTVSRVPVVSEYLIHEEESYVVNGVINNVAKDEYSVLIDEVNDDSNRVNRDDSTLLGIYHEEYKLEQSKLNNMYTRSGIMLAFLSAIVIYFNQIIDVTKVGDHSLADILNGLTVIGLIGTFALAIISLIVGIIYFVKVISIQKFKKLDFSEFDPENPKLGFNSVEERLFENYKSILCNNEKLIEKKALYLRKGYISTLACVASIFVNLLINKII